MAGIIGAIIIGIIIAFAEKAMKGGSQKAQEKPRTRTASVHNAARPPRRRPAPVVEAAAEPSRSSKPFLKADQEGVRVTVTESQSMPQVSRPVFTKSQQELRRTIILGEILRRKF